jgi:hypothetical protein
MATQPGFFQVLRPSRIFAAILLVILLLALPTLALADSDRAGSKTAVHRGTACGVYAVSGVVFDADTMVGIPDARLLLISQGRIRQGFLIVTTNASGEYQFTNVPAGVYLLIEINNPAWPHDASDNRMKLNLPCVPGLNGTTVDNNFADRR